MPRSNNNTAYFPCPTLHSLFNATPFEHTTILARVVRMVLALSLCGA